MIHFGRKNWWTPDADKWKLKQYKAGLTFLCGKQIGTIQLDFSGKYREIGWSE